MKKWYAEEYEFQIEVTGFLRGNSTERFCRNGEEIGDRYTCTYGCPVKWAGEREFAQDHDDFGFRLWKTVRSGGDLQNIGGSGPYTKDIVCPDGCVMFRMTAKKLGNENFYKGKIF